MKISSKLLMLCLFAFSAEVLASDEGYYFALGGGLSNGKIKFDGETHSGKYSKASMYSFALGKQFNENIAMDLEFGYRGDFVNDNQNVNDSGFDRQRSVSARSFSAMLNGYYYYYNKSTHFKPYITGGAGVVLNKFSNTTTNFIGKDEDNKDVDVSEVVSGAANKSFAWKIGTGVKCVLNNNFEVDFRYQFVDLGRLKLGNSTTIYEDGKLKKTILHSNPMGKIQSHEFLVGLVYKF